MKFIPKHQQGNALKQVEVTAKRIPLKRKYDTLNPLNIQQNDSVYDSSSFHKSNLIDFANSHQTEIQNRQDSLQAKGIVESPRVSTYEVGAKYGLQGLGIPSTKYPFKYIKK